MRPSTSGAAFAAAHAAMVRGDDGASTVHVLLVDCLELLGAETAGVLVRVGDRSPELLAATSHKAAELELYQAQVQSGPCVETIESGESVLVSGDQEIRGRWPNFGRAMTAAGLRTVLGAPMRWHGRVVGGLNLFWRTERTLTQEEHDLAAAFADISMLALMQAPAADDPTEVAQKLRAALDGRVVIERAKGVLAHTEHLEMDEAFVRLMQVSEESERPLSQVAQSVLDEVVTRDSD